MTKYPTSVSPYVNIDYTHGTLDLEGVSIQENPVEFYQPILDELHNLKFSETYTLIMNCSFRHFNTSSSKFIFEIMKVMQSMEIGNKDVTINWYYDSYDEDMKELGEDYEDLTGLKFNYQALSS